ncbi:uncharacterized protein LACBIDRAFT_312956 [Laccaria bicolor S238N-H82]|uniref:Predicted protein n=1 Tax=Laccaria bicolor (strain S238N-H82 / ATCC MYA-4686) TaxID=486041 RepID=B0DX74_LACBS|nr:uncharacterized protein LACBIDRAFT_312956 [Laccaria bicolor S238N-H82]EDR00744.1 predicted protein [Laccaria bicolor S238N-H82]|eukprot:XP_001888536.1 predicted protein [Laccaria bicolor S238N-H82]
MEALVANMDTSLSISPKSFTALRTRARINLHLKKYDASAEFKSAVKHVTTEGSASEVDVLALKVDLKKAEAALKRSKMKDYYKILWLTRECTEIEIKKAFRQESLTPSSQLEI